MVPMMVPTVAHLTMTDIERKCRGISCILATDRKVQKLACGQVGVSTDRTRASLVPTGVICPTGRHTLGRGADGLVTSTPQCDGAHPGGSAPADCRLPIVSPAGPSHRQWCGLTVEFSVPTHSSTR
jgi:hypothetical protein